jgi:hypothetical protein
MYILSLFVLTGVSIIAMVIAAVGVTLGVGLTNQDKIEIER